MKTYTSMPTRHPLWIDERDYFREFPCRGGWSHRPDEYSSPEQIAKGVEVLARTLARLAA
jgi:acetylornithine deacetylase/succinyl-diaminopimelate desuccinylase-like protein